MADEKENLLEGLLKAIEAEREGYSLYKMAADSTTDPKGKEVFATMAREEWEHIEFLQAQYDSVLKTGQPDRSVKLGPRADLSGGFPIFTHGLKERLGATSVETGALSIAVSLEKNAVKFYKWQSQTAKMPEVRRFFAELAEWETGHYDALIKQQEALQ
jgi:rubrerythrin